MEWTKDDKAALLSFKTQVDSDDIRLKEKIKKKLLNNRFIIRVLGNTELEENDAEPDEYYGINILPYYLIPDIQHTVNCYVCYETSYAELNRYNMVQKMQQVTFHIMCHKDYIIDRDTGICRHDLLGALIQNDFNWTKDFGHLASDKSAMTDKHFCVRELIFENWTDNNVVKTKNKTPIMMNKAGIFDEESKPKD